MFCINRVLAIVVILFSGSSIANTCGLTDFVKGYIEASQKANSTENLISYFDSELNQKYKDSLLESSKNPKGREAVERRWSWLTKVIGATIKSELEILADCESNSVYIKGLNSGNEKIVFFLRLQENETGYKIKVLHSFQSVGTMCDAVKGTDDF